MRRRLVLLVTDKSDDSDDSDSEIENNIIIPKVKKGDRVFINGGSGGVGAFGIQFSKVAGCHVTTSCSTRNVELCKSLGADTVIDYTKEDVFEALTGSGEKFDHAVDNVGSKRKLFWGAHEFMKPSATLVIVAGEPSLSSIIDSIKRKVLPRFLGGVKGNLEGFWPVPNEKDMAQIAGWMKEGKVKAVIDQKFAFGEAPKAFEKLKTGRARGKIVVDVASETYKNAWAET